MSLTCCQDGRVPLENLPQATCTSCTEGSCFNSVSVSVFHSLPIFYLRVCIKLFYCQSVCFSCISVSIFCLHFHLPLCCPSHQCNKTHHCSTDFSPVQCVLLLSGKLGASKYEAHGNRVDLFIDLFIFSHVDPFTRVASVSHVGSYSCHRSSVGSL